MAVVHAAARRSPSPARLAVLKKRADFLRAARGKRQVAPGFVLQGWNRRDEAPQRVGFTCSKKVGNAVARNRAKRRLRALAQAVLPAHGVDGWDYVLIGRAGVTGSRPFTQMTDDLVQALHRLHRSRAPDRAARER